MSFQVIPRPTNITGLYNDQPLYNDTTIVNKYFANSSADGIIINLEYYDVLNTIVLSTSAPTLESFIPITSVIKEGNMSWTIIFNPNQTGIFVINLTFSLNNYTSALFIFHLIINKAETSIYLSLPNNPELSYGTFTDFFFLYINTNYNENITGLTEGAGITLNNTNISFLNRTGNCYWFRLSPTILPLGIHITNITFFHSYFENTSSIVIFNVFDRTMAIDNSLSNPTNEQSIDFLQQGERYFFNVFLNDSETNNPVNASIFSLPSKIEFLGIVSDGNHSFSYNASLIGDFINLTIVFTRENYESIIYTISFTISPRNMVLESDLSTSQTIDYLQVGDIFYFNVYLNDSRTGESLNISTYAQLPLNVFFENYSTNYGHLFYYNALNRGVFLLDINFSLPFYTDYSYPLNFTVSKAESELVASSLTINTFYNLNAEFYIVWLNIPNPVINSSPLFQITNTSNIEIQPSQSGWSESIILYEIENGNYSFLILADQIGTITVLISFHSNDFYPEPSHINLTITIFPAPSDFGVTSQTNGSKIGEEKSFYYTETREISIQWIESIFGLSIIDIKPEFIGDWEGFITFEDHFDNGTHVFTINGSKIGLYQLSVILETTNYSRVAFVLVFNISIMPTFEPVINYQSERIVGQVLTITVESWLSINNNSVPFGETKVFNKSRSLSFVPTTTQEFVFILTLSTEDFRQGSHNLTLVLSSIYGFENQSLDVLFEIIGREILISISKYSERLVQGEDFIVLAILKYAPLEIDIGGAGAGMALISLEDVPVSFLVEILYENGTIRTLVFNTAANATGMAEFLVMGRYTLKAEGIKGITVSTGATASSKASSQTTPSNYILENGFEKPIDLMQTLFFLFFGIFLAIIIGITTLGGYRRLKGKSLREKSAGKIFVDGKRETRWIDDFPPSIKIHEPEIKYLFNFISKRITGRWAGKTSLFTLSKNLPNDISKENLKLVFKVLHEETNYFVLERTVIAITEEGRKITTLILAESLVETKDELPLQEDVNQETRWIDDFPTFFSDYKKEIIYLFKLVMERKKTLHGKTTLNYLISHSSADLSDSNLKSLFDDISIKTTYFIKEKKSIVITEEGKKMALRIQKSGVHD